MSSTAGDIVRAVGERLSSAASRAMHLFQPATPETEAFLRRLLGNLPGMAYRCRNDADWTMEFVSPGARALTGFDPRDLVGNQKVSYGELIHPEDRERVWNLVQESVRGGERFQCVYRIRRVDGDERWVWEQGCVVHDALGEVEAIEGFITDITDQTQVAERLADQETQFRALVEQSLTGVFVARGDRLSYVNSRFARIFAYTRAELLAMESLGDLVHPDHRHAFMETLRRSPTSKRRGFRFETRGLRKDGTACDIELHGSRVELTGGWAIVGTLLDISDRKRAQRRYFEQEKMQALGRLAAGVAHDVNNFLSVVKTTAFILGKERSDDARLVDDLDEIVRAVDRAAAYGTQLMAFGAPRPAGVRTIAVQALVDELQSILHRMVGSRVALEVEVDPDLPKLRMDPMHLEEVFTNLVLNAADATPGGGTVSLLATRPMVGDPDTPRALRDEVCVLIEVVDEGSGISPDHKKRIFEPYFTTKGDDGTGLGLANVWRIVHDAGGVIEVDSEVGSGSRFRVFLPADPSEPALY